MLTIFGKVTHGSHYGRTLGFPTANLDRREYVRKKLKVKFGVWAGWAEIESRSKNQEVRKFKSGIVIGPLDARGLPKIEAHLIGFNKDLYGKNLTVTLKKYLRSFKKFKTVELLKAQIKKDIEKIKKLNLK